MIVIAQIQKIINDYTRQLGRVKIVKDDGTVTDPATETTLALIKNTDGIKKITDALPSGTNTIGKVQLTDQYGFASELTPMDEVRTISPVRLCGSTFVGTTKDANFWTETVANNGTVAQANGQVVLSTNVTSPNGSAIYQSVRMARYVGSSSNRFRAQIQLGDTGEVDNSRKWGAFDANNGACFELDGTTLYIVTLKTGAPTRVASASWNASVTVPTLTDCQTYEIYWTNKSVYFVIAGVLKHTVSATAATWTDTTTLPVRVSATNANTLQTQHAISVRVAAIVRLGELQTDSIYKNLTGAATTVLKYGAGRLHRVILNTTGGTSITLYDNTSALAPIIATITAGAIVSLEYDVPFFTGLTAVTVGAGCDMTVIYE